MSDNTKCVLVYIAAIVVFFAFAALSVWLDCGFKGVC